MLDSETRKDYEYKIFSIPSSALARTNVILAGKRGSRRHSATSCSTSIVVGETSYQILEVQSFCNRERAKPSPIKLNNRTNFQVENSAIKLSGLNIFSTVREKTLS